MLGDGLPDQLGLVRGEEVDRAQVVLDVIELRLEPLLARSVSAGLELRMHFVDGAPHPVVRLAQPRVGDRVDAVDAPRVHDRIALERVERKARLERTHAPLERPALAVRAHEPDEARHGGHAEDEARGVAGQQAGQPVVAIPNRSQPAKRYRAPRPEPLPFGAC